MNIDQITPTGKRRLYSKEEAIQFQQALIESGRRYCGKNQQPRANAFGVQWNEENIFWTSREKVFRYYAGGTQSKGNYPKEPRTYKTAEERRNQAVRAVQTRREMTAKRIVDLTATVIKAKKQIGAYEPLLFGFHSRNHIRLEAWEKFVEKILELSPFRPRAANLRVALRIVLDEENKPYRLPENSRFYKMIKK